MSAGKRGSRQASEVPRLVPKAHGDVATQDENQKRALGIDKHAADRQSWTLVDLGFKTSGLMSMQCIAQMVFDLSRTTESTSCAWTSCLVACSEPTSSHLSHPGRSRLCIAPCSSVFAKHRRCFVRFPPDEFRTQLCSQSTAHLQKVRSGCAA